MPKTILVGGILFIFVAVITGFLKYRTETCEEYTARIKKEATDAMAKGLTIYQVVDADLYECANTPEPSYTYIPYASPTPIPRVSPR